MKNLTDYEKSLLKWLKRERPTIYYSVYHVSRSGMFRRISFYIIQDNKPLCIDWLIAIMTHYKKDKNARGLKVSGCGMDMGFAVIYDFGRSVFPKGFRYRKDESHRNNDPGPVDKDGGYAFGHRAL